VVRSDRPPSRRELLITLAVWAGPLVLAPPLFSRDVYSYLAQGAMVHAHIDVYTYGPDRLGGPVAAEVAPVWQGTPAPYGPLFLGLAAALAPAGITGMRLVALAGVGLMIGLLPVLARRCGVPPEAALWLGALNPLVLLHLIGGAHNDAVMLGLLGAGMVTALGGSFLCAAGLVTLAALVKAPAALGLLVVASQWSGRLDGRWRMARAAAYTAAVAGAVTAVVTAISGTGYGWLGALGTPAASYTWSLTTTLGRLTGALLTDAGSGLAPLALPAWRWLGLAAAGAVMLYAWRRRLRLGPVYALGISLAAVALLGPAIRPWYVLWGCFLIAAAAPAPYGRVRKGVAALSAVLALMVLPSGFAASADQLALAVCGGLLAAVALLCVRTAL
jgi:alpha-1,6-mannosyltransferase